MKEIGVAIDLDELTKDLSTKKKAKLFDAFLINMPQVDCPLDNQFYPGLHIRERFVPAGTLFTTYTWKVTHPYRCIRGELLIWQENVGWELFTAPCKGITYAGTKRIVFAIDDVIWETLHANPTDTQDEKELHDMLFENYENEFVDLTQLQEINKCQQSLPEQP